MDRHIRETRLSMHLCKRWPWGVTWRTSTILWFVMSFSWKSIKKVFKCIHGCFKLIGESLLKASLLPWSYLTIWLPVHPFSPISKTSSWFGSLLFLFVVAIWAILSWCWTSCATKLGFCTTLAKNAIIRCCHCSITCSRSSNDCKSNSVPCHVLTKVLYMLHKRWLVVYLTTS